MSIWDRDDLGSIAQTVCWTLFGATAVTVGLRLYCRLRYGPRLGGGIHVDDFITVGCLLVLLTFCILLSIALPFGVGQHYQTLSAATQAQALKWNAILNAATPWLCTLPKFAIVSTLERILSYSTRTRVMLWGPALVCQASVLVLVVWDFAQCSPAAFQWDQSIKGGICANRSIYVGLAWFTYVFSTALDVFFALYPVPSVMRLNMPLKTRVSVALSLSISWFGFAISVYKFSIFPRFGIIMKTDPSYPLVYLSMTHFAEGSFLIMSTSLATLRPLYRGLRRQITARTSIRTSMIIPPKMRSQALWYLEVATTTPTTLR
ncbi:hypothetical protein M406DRAFT_327988 [Cryphonectria parasitica EP155]|uniref:Rhodopsin domain-containing protein n=1 Tax=Cryphonectria parasitica (strain ATCC 38755 / EP155) TaxID=660469 RepID=A0A9P4Y544_CRYP1|nr:uncharacterized protein M406DRAFT_327988 [Cryphonectria parasitica EP155]KAF3766873.1 hypothetical protein M406DRAFT_327988 [Cryphonectria parasitica EP155]